MKQDTQAHSLSAWTEIEYSPRCSSAFLSAPIFIPEETKYFLCHADGSRKEARLTFVVFRDTADGEEAEWEDDPIIGNMQLCVLGDGDEEVSPVNVTYLGVRPEEFIKVVNDDDDTISFSIAWPYGSVTIDKSEQDGDIFTIKKESFGEDGIVCQLTPRRGSAFSIRLQIPFTGFMLKDANGNAVEGDMEINHNDIDDYTYAFIADGKNDRFSISLDDNKLNYLCVAREDGTLAVRDMRERLQIVTEIECEGRLSQLLMGAHALLVKNKNSRWRITLTGGSIEVSDELECDPVSLARFAFTQFSGIEADGKEALASQLILLEEKMNFQWYWLNEEDWSHENLEGLIDMEGIESNPEKMMQQALLFNRFETFMKRLSALSFVSEKPIQADQLQARNNKRKIARCVKHVLAHQNGKENIWELDDESRSEILHFFGSYHREFVTALSA